MKIQMIVFVSLVFIFLRTDEIKCDKSAASSSLSSSSSSSLSTTTTTPSSSLSSLLVSSLSSKSSLLSSSASSLVKGSLASAANPLVKSLIKETLAYIAAPIFMPIAIGRTLRSPPGLGPNGSPVQRFARYLFKLATMRKNDAEEQLKNDLMQLLNSHRRNVVLTMKQYRQMERSAKSSSSLRKNHRKDS